MEASSPADSGWRPKTASGLQPAAPRPSCDRRSRPSLGAHPSRRSSLGMAFPITSAATAPLDPSGRASVASFISTSDIDVSNMNKAINLLQAMVSLPGSTARNSLDLPGAGPGGGAPGGAPLPMPFSLETGPSSSVCFSPRSAASACFSPRTTNHGALASAAAATTSGSVAVGGGGGGGFGISVSGIAVGAKQSSQASPASSVSSALRPALQSPATPRPGTCSGRPATTTGVRATSEPVGSAGAISMAVAEAVVVAVGRQTDPGPAVPAVALPDSAFHAAKQPASRPSIDAAADALELATRQASTSVAATVPMFCRPKPRPSQLQEAVTARRVQQEQQQLYAPELEEGGDAEGSGTIVAFGGGWTGSSGAFFSMGGGGGGDAGSGPNSSNESGGRHAAVRSSAPCLGQASHREAAWGLADEWSFGGNLQRARQKARYAAIDTAGELRYVPVASLPPSAGGAAAGGAASRRASSFGSGGSGGGRSSDSRKPKLLAWKLLSSFAARAIGGGGGKPAAAPPPPARQPPRPSMAEEPMHVQRSRDSRRLLLVQRVRLAMDGEPPPLPAQSQKRAAGPAAAAVAAAAKKAAAAGGAAAGGAVAVGLQEGKACEGLQLQQERAAAAASAPAPPAAAAPVAAPAAVQGDHARPEGEGEVEDELEARMLAAAAEFAAATAGDLRRGSSLS